MPGPIAIALSGGVDSLVSAALLKDAGHSLTGIHFLTGYELAPGRQAQGSIADANAAGEHASVAESVKDMAAQLDIPLTIVDLSVAFQQEVVDYFRKSYQSGRTPNPCLVCNPAIKFGLLATMAKQQGAEAMATGHYARISQSSNRRWRLLRGIDPVKDQSYFLSRLTQSQLKNIRLPLGNYTKTQTRRMAAERGLRPSTADESQDICFIKEGGYGDFLQCQPGFISRPGPITDLQGREIGRHKGLHLFTVGQRRGINCPAAQPYYVVRLDTSDNRLVVGFKEDLLSDTCQVSEINWIIESPHDAMDIEVRVRYRHTAVPARLIPLGRSRARIEFEQAQTAVTPGQGAVFYNEDEVLGGGWIE